MIRHRRVAGHSLALPGRAQLAEALAAAELSDQALVNYAALRRFSGDAWIDRYRDHLRRTAPPQTVFIPEQRKPHQGRWEAFLASSYGAGRHGLPLHGAAANSVAAKNARKGRPDA